MITVILGIIFGVFSAASAVYLIATYAVNSNNYNSGNNKSYAIPSILLVVSILSLAFIPWSFVQVNAGQRGVVLNLGRVTNTTFGEGLHMKQPYLQSVVIMDVQVQAHKIVATAASKDLQDVSTEVTLNFRLRPEKVNLIYQTLRTDYTVRVIDPGIQEAVKSVTALYNAEELIAKRASVRDEIDSRLDARLEEHGIFVEQVNITDFDFSESFNEAIESKVTAAQNALRAINDLTRIQTEAEQVRARAAGERDATIARAEAEKQKRILEAEGEAQSIILRANAQTEANIKISSSLTDILVRWQTVTQLSSTITTIVLPTGTDFILGESVLGVK